MKSPLATANPATVAARRWPIVANMDFALSAKANDYHKRLSEFMVELVFPAEAEYDRYRHEAGPDDHTAPPVLEDLKAKAKERGLWNLFLPAESGLSNLDYAPLAELSGWSMEIAPEALNCAAPDTGNMETLHLFATDEQRKQWLQPLLDGEIRSAFSMTEPAVASSDARNIETLITRDGGDYVINGRKWWTSGAADPRCRVLIVMGRTNPEAASHQQQSMVLVPIDTPGVTVVRSTSVFGWQDQHGHCEISYDDVRVPVTNLLGEEGSGFAIAQARLGPGRIHHCMRALGAAERALALMVDRVQKRVAFGRPLAEQGVVRESIAKISQRARPGAATVRKGGVDHRSTRQQSRSSAGIPDQGSSPAGGVSGHRPRHPGAWGRRCQRRHRAGPAVRVASRHADLRRPRRGAHAHHRPHGTGPREERYGRGGHLTWLSAPANCRARGIFATWQTATGVVRPGRLFRSGELSELGDDGRAELRRSGVTDVADLRSRREVQRNGPGRVPNGVEIHLLPIPDDAPDESEKPNPDGAAPHEHAFKRLLEDKPDGESVEAASNRYMVDEYSRFPTYNGAQQALHRVITLLGSGRTVLTHCFAGKDRTGFVMALVLEAAGVERDAIIDDFLCSNDGRPAACVSRYSSRFGSARTSKSLRSCLPSPRRDWPTMCSVCARSTWLRRGAAIDEQFGSLQRTICAARASRRHDVHRLRQSPARLTPCHI